MSCKLQSVNPLEFPRSMGLRSLNPKSSKPQTLIHPYKPQTLSSLNLELTPSIF